MNLEVSELGKKSLYKTTYDKELLFPIPRQVKRAELGLTSVNHPFFGYDIWNAYEVS
jgi:7-cyano-7-deazaguanine reductase